MVIIELENKDNASSSVTYSIKDGCDVSFDKDAGCDWFTIETVKGTGGAKDIIKITTPKANEGERRTCYVTPKVGEYLCSSNKFMVAQGEGSPTPPGPKPDPKPENCVTPLDNIGQDCTGSKTAIQEFIDAKYVGCEGNKWWSGPLNSHDDVGVGIKGEGDNPGDGIRCTPTNLRLEPSSSWIHYTIDSEPHEEFKGWVHYTIDANPSSSPRSGTVKVTLINPENTDKEWEGKEIGTPFCMGGEGAEMYVYVYQRGGSSPSTCTLEVSGNSSSSLPPIPASGASIFIPVGTYETDCEGEWGKPTPTEGGVDFVTEWRFRGDVLYAKANENTGKARSTKYNVTKGDANDDFTIDQNGSDSCDKEKAAFSITGKTIGYESMSMYTVAEFTANCTDRAVVHYESGEKIVSDSDINSCTVKDGVIKCPVTENETDSARTGSYSVYIGEERCDGFTITQNPLVFSINGNTSDFSYDVSSAFYPTTYVIDNSKEAHFEITGSGGGDDAYCTINGILEGNIGTTGTHNVNIGSFTENSIRYITFTDKSDSSKTIKLTLNINRGY